MTPRDDQDGEEEGDGLNDMVEHDINNIKMV